MATIRNGINRPPRSGEDSNFDQIPYSLHLRGSRYAIENFGIGDNRTSFHSSGVPKPKFLFYVQFILGGDEFLRSSSLASNINRVDNGIVFKIKNIDRPKFNLKTETLNQYNKKRVIQTGVEYQNLTCVFHDDVANKVMEFWREYYAYYYGEGRRQNPSDWNNDQTLERFNDPFGHGWGYRGDFGYGLTGSSETHFIDRINLFTMYGGYYTSVTYINPKITLFDHDNNDYEEGREGIGIRMSFDYEGVVYNLNPRRINSADVPSATDSLLPTIDGSQINAAEDYGETYYSNAPRDYELYSLIHEPIRNYNDLFRLNAVRYGGARGNQSVTPLSTLLGTIRNVSESVDLVRALANQSTGRSSTLRAQNYTFGQNVMGLRSRVIDVITATSASGRTPSQSAIQQATGVRTQVDTFGRTSQFSNRSNTVRMVPLNTNSGYDTNQLAQASAAIGDITTTSRIVEESVSPGRTRLNTNQSNPFSRTLGVVSVLSQAQGLVQSTSQNIVAQNSQTLDNPTMFNKLPDGRIELTERGAFAIQASRSGTSAYGTTRIPMQKIDNNNRELVALNNEINNLATVT